MVLRQALRRLVRWALKEHLDVQLKDVTITTNTIEMHNVHIHSQTLRDALRRTHNLQLLKASAHKIIVALPWAPPLPSGSRVELVRLRAALAPAAPRPPSPAVVLPKRVASPLPALPPAVASAPSSGDDNEATISGDMERRGLQALASLCWRLLNSVEMTAADTSIRLVERPSVATVGAASSAAGGSLAPVSGAGQESPPPPPPPPPQQQRKRQQRRDNGSPRIDEPAASAVADSLTSAGDAVAGLELRIRWIQMSEETLRATTHGSRMTAAPAAVAEEFSRGIRFSKMSLALLRGALIEPWAQVPPLPPCVDRSLCGAQHERVYPLAIVGAASASDPDGGSMRLRYAGPTPADGSATAALRGDAASAEVDCMLRSVQVLLSVDDVRAASRLIMHLLGRSPAYHGAPSTPAPSAATAEAADALPSSPPHESELVASLRKVARLLQAMLAEAEEASSASGGGAAAGNAAPLQREDGDGGGGAAACTRASWCCRLRVHKIKLALFELPRASFPTAPLLLLSAFKSAYDVVDANTCDGGGHGGVGGLQFSGTHEWLQVDERELHPSGSVPTRRGRSQVLPHLACQPLDPDEGCGDRLDPALEARLAKWAAPSAGGGGRERHDDDSAWIRE